MPVFCSRCGTRNADGAVVCVDCGSPLAAAVPPTAPDSSTALVGRVLGGRYRVDSFIAKGAMGSVYKGTHVDLGDTVAIKVMHPGFTVETELVERFRREARAQASLKDENIVAVRDFVAGGGVVAFVMEYVEGPTLEEELKRHGGPMPPARCLEILRPVLEALDHAHDAGIVHRDLKPSNVILTAVRGREVPKLMDFGLVKVVAEAKKLTLPGTMMGTPHYMAPEQFVDPSKVDLRGDVYSLGVILYEMLVGRLPFQASTWDEFRCCHATVDPPPPRSLVPSIPDPVEKAVLRALAKSPADRFQSVAKLILALDAALAPGGVPSRPAPGAGAAPEVARVEHPAPAPLAPQPPAERFVAEQPHAPAPPVPSPIGVPQPVGGPVSAPAAPRRRPAWLGWVVAGLAAAALGGLALLIAGRGRSGGQAGGGDEGAAVHVAASAATALDAGSRERTSEPPARASAKDAAPAQVPLLPVALPDAVAAGDDAGAGAAAGGEFCDPTSGLCWQDPPAPTSMSWDDAIAYCRRLALAGHGAGEWHLPTIDELRSLIRGCPATEPRGTCAVTDPSCLGAGCWTEVCSGCSRNGGPGAGGCYWPEGLAGSCSWYWSSSSYAGSASYAWYVYFNYGGVHFYGKTYTHYVRCVRRGPRLGL